MSPRELSILADRLKALREKAGLSQQEVAMRAKLSLSAIAQIEQGVNKDPKLSTLSAIAEALGCDAGELVTDLSGKPKKK